MGENVDYAYSGTNTAIAKDQTILTMAWTFGKTMPGSGLGDNEADLEINLGDNGDWSRLRQVQRVRHRDPGSECGSPDHGIAGRLATSGTCYGYYQQKLAEWQANPPIQWAYRSWSTSGTDLGLTNISPGFEVSSLVTHNSSSGGADYGKDGRW